MSLVHKRGQEFIGSTVEVCLFDFSLRPFICSAPHRAWDPDPLSLPKEEEGHG